MSTLKNEYRHIPVLLDEVVQHLDEEGILNASIFVDCTIGGAGHSIEIAKKIGPNGLIIGIDQDQEALDAAKIRLNSIDEKLRPKIVLVNDNFKNLDNILLEQEIPYIASILMDLGMSSHQIDDISRGFSFKEDSPLDMRMDPKQTLNAAKIVNFYSISNLIWVLRNLGEEKFAVEIARKIVEERENHPIETSSQLVNIIKDAIPAPARRKGGHPAKRTFQALRIEVNSELNALKEGLEAAIRWLKPNGRIAVISYHSLEDRIVKDAFNDAVNRCVCPPDLPECVCGKKPIVEVLTKKPIVPSQNEIDKNSRSRSAKLRIAKKL